MARVRRLKGMTESPACRRCGAATLSSMASLCQQCFALAQSSVVPPDVAEIVSEVAREAVSSGLGMIGRLLLFVVLALVIAGILLLQPGSASAGEMAVMAVGLAFFGFGIFGAFRQYW
jgi:hypothetical protein